MAVAVPCLGETQRAGSQPAGPATCNHDAARTSAAYAAQKNAKKLDKLFAVRCYSVTSGLITPSQIMRSYITPSSPPGPKDRRAAWWPVRCGSLTHWPETKAVTDGGREEAAWRKPKPKRLQQRTYFNSLFAHIRNLLIQGGENLKKWTP